MFNLDGEQSRLAEDSASIALHANETKPDCDPAIGQHLLDNKQCAFNYDDKRFSILATAFSSFHLNLRQVLYKQKVFVNILKLF